MGKPIPHGTKNGYSNYGCRCADCKEAEAAYRKKRYTLRPRKPREPKPFRHGTTNGYRYHKCRCVECKAAASECNRKQRAKPKDPNKIPHGTPQGYRYHKCRCESCTTASSEAHSRYREANVEKERKRKLRWRQENPEKAYEAARKHREANPEMYRDISRRWREADPKRTANITSAANHRRRALMMAAFVEDVPPLEIFERDNWQCQIPGCIYPDIPATLNVGRYDPLLASLDHIVPLSKGGKHERSNLACSHLRCNQKKHTRIEGIA